MPAGGGELPSGMWRAGPGTPLKTSESRGSAPPPAAGLSCPNVTVPRTRHRGRRRPLCTWVFSYVKWGRWHAGHRL